MKLDGDVTGTPLERLCAHRGVAVAVDGALLDLAPVLDIRPVDLLAIAGVAIPGGSVPAAPEATHLLERMVGYDGPPIAPAEALRDYARSLPATTTADGRAGLSALETVTSGAVFSRLLRVRNLSREAMARATGSASSTVARAMGTGVLMPAQLELMAATLCLRADDFAAMMVRRPGAPPADAAVRQDVPRLWVVGELFLALAPLRLEQIEAVAAFARRLRKSLPRP